jgi:hypothetical protein
MAIEPTTVPTLSTSKDKFRLSQSNLQNTSIANELGTTSGRFNVEKAVDLLLETRKSNKLLTKVIIGLIAYSILLTVAIFGVSIAAAEIAKDTTIDPVTGFVHAKNGNAIMKTALATEFTSDSIHGMSDEDLARLLTVNFHDGALVFQVKGFSSTEEKTMLLIEGGVLTFDDSRIVDVAGDHVNLLVEAFGIEGEGRKLSIKTSYGGVLKRGGAGG